MTDLSFDRWIEAGTDQTYSEWYEAEEARMHAPKPDFAQQLALLNVYFANQTGAAQMQMGNLYSPAHGLGAAWQQAGLGASLGLSELLGGLGSTLGKRR